MRTLVTGLSEVVTGDIAAPLADADSLLIEDGRFVAIGRGLDDDADVVIDANGATAFPGPGHRRAQGAGDRRTARVQIGRASCRERVLVTV